MSIEQNKALMRRWHAEVWGRGEEERIPEFIAEYVSEKALGEEGYLADKGLIPPLENEIGKIREDAKAMKPLKL